MDIGTALGILLTVVFGVVGIYAGLRLIKKKSQKQVVHDHSAGIQSGRDTNIKS